MEASTLSQLLFVNTDAFIAEIAFITTRNHLKMQTRTILSICIIVVLVTRDANCYTVLFFLNKSARCVSNTKPYEYVVLLLKLLILYANYQFCLAVLTTLC